jgi:hypothetical protein
VKKLKLKQIDFWSKLIPWQGFEKEKKKNPVGKGLRDQV